MFRKENEKDEEGGDTNTGIERVLSVGGFGGLTGVFEEEDPIEVVLLQIHGN